MQSRCTINPLYYAFGTWDGMHNRVILYYCKTMTFGLIMAFVDQSPSFAHGFEAGKLYQQMSDGRLLIEGTFHLANYEQFKQMADVHSYRITKFISADDCWINLKLVKNGWRGQVAATVKDLQEKAATQISRLIPASLKQEN